MQVSALRTQVQRIETTLQEHVTETLYVPNTLLTASNKGGWVVWIFKDGGWQIKEAKCADGYIPGPPPPFTGSFDGFCVRQNAVPHSLQR
jgi:hypothetical protein